MSTSLLRWIWTHGNCCVNPLTSWSAHIRMASSARGRASVMCIQIAVPGYVATLRQHPCCPWLVLSIVRSWIINIRFFMLHSRRSMLHVGSFWVLRLRPRPVGPSITARRRNCVGQAPANPAAGASEPRQSACGTCSAVARRYASFKGPCG